MKKLCHTKLWEMLRNPTAASCQDIKAAFDEFIEEVSAYCRKEADIAERTRTLTLAKSEFRLHLEEQQHRIKKNVQLRRVIKQIIYFIDSEIDIIKLDLEYPDRFIVFPADHAPLARWGGNVVDLIEYFIGPQAAGIIQHPSGKPMNFEETVETLKKETEAE